MREATLNRKTAETDISLRLNLDGTGKAEISTGIGFFDHMLTLFACHSRMDLSLTCRGDLSVDCHHTVEDIGIVLGTALHEALGDRAGLNRYGFFVLPMDEALSLCAVDLDGRGTCVFQAALPAGSVGDFDTETAQEFFTAVARCTGAAIHIRELSGVNTHHILESIFKGFGRALRMAVAVDPALNGAVASTKGSLV